MSRPEGASTVRGARVTEANVAALSEAFTAVEMVRALASPTVALLTVATARAAGDVLMASRWPDGRRLRIPTVGARADDPAEGHVVLLEGLALTEDLVLGLAGRALERATRQLVGDDDVPGELTGALTALLSVVKQRASRRVVEKIQARFPEGKAR